MMSPSIHSPSTRTMSANGMQVTAIMMSAKARFARRRLMADRMAGFWYTIKHTMQFPNTAIMIINTMAMLRMMTAPSPIGSSGCIVLDSLPRDIVETSVVSSHGELLVDSADSVEAAVEKSAVVVVVAVVSMATGGGGTGMLLTGKLLKSGIHKSKIIPLS